MLLLVLIFVLAAFGLLLVALVTGSAAWAWASVAVSVAAAGALVFDWVQRRAAVSDGSRAGSPVGAGTRVGGAIEPPTTMMPPMGGQGQQESATQVMRPLGTPGGEGPRRADHQYAATPPGSGEQPSSAASGLGQAGGNWSQSVTGSPSGVGPEGATPSGDTRSGADSAGVAGAAAAAGQRPGGEQPGSGADQAPGGSRDKSLAWKSAMSGSDPVMAKGGKDGSGGPAPADVAADRPDAKAADAGHPNVPGQPGAGGAAPADKAAAEQGAVTDSERSAAASTHDQPTTAIRADQINAPASNPLFTSATPAQPPADSEPTKSDATAEGGAATTGSESKPDDKPADKQGASAAGQAPAKADGAGGPDTAGSGTAAKVAAGAAAAAGVVAAAGSKVGKPDDGPKDAGAEQDTAPKADAGAKSDTAAKSDSDKASRPAEQQPAGDADATQAISAVRPAPEAGEERVDPAAAAIVAKLDDEVLVVDEQPRYHLEGCRTLVGLETIPLPVREAVEYEFTPCDTCTPARVLAARNRASSKS